MPSLSFWKEPTMSKARPITSDVVCPACGGLMQISEDGEQVCTEVQCGYRVEKDS
jgi:hypothetical protein